MLGQAACRVGINGFGRIGRGFFLAAGQPGSGVEVVALNDPNSIEALAYNLRTDSTWGAFGGTIEVRSGELVVNGSAISVSHHQDPSEIQWKRDGVDVVVESSGHFRTGDSARGHLAAGAQKVIISASAERPDATIVYGVNHASYNRVHHDVISTASCGVNALGVTALSLVTEFGLHEPYVTIQLARQGWHRPHDTGSNPSRNDLRLARNMDNIIPCDHVDTTLLRGALPELGEVMSDVTAASQPVVGSYVTLWGRLRKPSTAAEINAALKAASAGTLSGLLAYSHVQPGPVSADAVGQTVSCLFDPSGTTVSDDGFRVKVRGFFDGERAPAQRLLDMVKLVAV